MEAIVVSVVVPHVPLQIPGNGKQSPPKFKSLLLATVQQYGFGCGTELPMARSCQCNGNSDGRGNYAGGSFDACEVAPTFAYPPIMQAPLAPAPSSPSPSASNPPAPSGPVQAPAFTFVLPSEPLQLLASATGHCVLGGNTPTGPNNQNVKAAVDSRFRQIEMYVAIGGGTLLVIALMAGVYGVYRLLEDRKQEAKLKRKIVG